MPNNQIVKSACLLGVLSAICCIAAYADFPYRPRLDGDMPPALKAEMEAHLEVFAQQNDSPASEMHLRRRIARDEARFLDAARALGYFSAYFSFELETATKPALLILRAITGPQYHLGAVSVQVAGNMMPPPTWLAEVRLQEGDPALSDAIYDAEARLLQVIQNSGYPFPVMQNLDVAVNHGNKRVNVTFEVATGPRAVFGEVRITGLEKVKDQTVLDALPWREGDPYQAHLLDDAQRNLFALGLFGMVNVAPEAEAGGDGSLPVLVQVSERKHRTIGLGVDYSTDDGAGAQLNWEHRNIRGLGQSLSLKLNMNQRIWGMEARYVLDNLGHPGQKLILSGAVLTEDIDAYDARIARFGALFERKLTERLVLQYGGGIHLSETKQLTLRDTHQIAYGEVSVRYDRTDDALDPKRGYRVQASLLPHVGFTSNPLFIKGEVSLSYYWRLNQEAETPEGDRPLVLATRLKLGSTWGESWRGIPAELRYYSGGGGALRGYPYKTVSPLIGKTPLGGESVYEFSVELRKKVRENIGVALFVENGTAFNGSFLNAYGQSVWAVGVGGRYYSPIGPMRIDLAVPLDKRKGIDSPFQVYFSIGQAF